MAGEHVKPITSFFTNSRLACIAGQKSSACRGEQIVNRTSNVESSPDDACEGAQRNEDPDEITQPPARNKEVESFEAVTEVQLVPVRIFLMIAM